MLRNGQEKNKQTPKNSQKGFECLSSLVSISVRLHLQACIFLPGSYLKMTQHVFTGMEKKTKCHCFLAVLHLNISIIWCNCCNVAALPRCFFVLVARIPLMNLRCDYSFILIFEPFTMTSHVATGRRIGMVGRSKGKECSLTFWGNKILRRKNHKDLVITCISDKQAHLTAKGMIIHEEIRLY